MFRCKSIILFGRWTTNALATYLVRSQCTEVVTASVIVACIIVVVRLELQETERERVF